MQQITYFRSSYNREAGRWHRDTLAAFSLEGTALRPISGEARHWHPGAIELYDPVHDEMLTLADHGERWAQFLPVAYATGPIEVEVREVPSRKVPRRTRRSERTLARARS